MLVLPVLHQYNFIDARLHLTDMGSRQSSATVDAYVIWKAIPVINMCCFSHAFFASTWCGLKGLETLRYSLHLSH